MSETPFAKFIALVHIDQQINTLSRSIKEFENQNVQLQAAIVKNNETLEKSKQVLVDIRKEVSNKELEMKILDEQEAQKKSRLETVSNHKEYQPIKAEIDQLKRQQHELEEGLVGAWNKLENTKKEYDATVAVIEQKNKELEEKKASNNKSVDDLKGQVVALQKETATQEQTIPAEWLEKYAVMRAKVSDPVVPVVNGNCTACFYRVSPQDLSFLKHRKLIQCKDCFRLLYLPEVHQNLSAENKQ